MCDSYHPATAPRKNSVGRLLKNLKSEETCVLIVDALLQQSMFKGFDFTLLSERNQIFEFILPRLPIPRYKKLYTNKHKTHFSMCIEIYIVSFLLLKCLTCCGIIHSNRMSFSDNIFCRPSVSQPICLSFHPFINFRYLFFKFSKTVG